MNLITSILKESIKYLFFIFAKTKPQPVKIGLTSIVVFDKTIMARRFY